MKVRESYIIKKKTVLFIAKRDLYGYPYTIVMEDGNIFRVPKYITSLIDENLRYYGSSLQGANQGAHQIFGKKTRVHPILISEKLGVYWLRSKSTASADTIWLALHHVEKFSAIGEKVTQVLLSNGSLIELDISFDAFQLKMHRIDTLKSTIKTRTKNEPELMKEPMMQYYSNKPTGSLNYELKKMKEAFEKKKQ